MASIDLQTFEARIWLVARALQAALRTSNVPQRLDYFFPEPKGQRGDQPFDEWVAPANVMREWRDRKWQSNFMVMLSAKGAVTVSGNHASVKNRYFFENLIQGIKKRGPEYSVMLDMVWQAGGGEAGGWKTLVGNEKPAQMAQAPSSPPPPPPPVEEAVEVAPAEVEQEAQEPTPPRDALDILGNIENMVTAVLTIEEKLAENIIYVRDRGDKLHEKFKSLNERIAALEAKLAIPTPQEPVEPVIDLELRQQVQSVVASVNSMGEAVTAMKQDVQQVIESTLNQKPSERIEQIQSSLNRIASEFGALRELALETFAEASR